MPAPALRREIAALLGYVCVAIAFAWPLPLRLADAMIGLPAGDAGVYVWNLWVFRHEIVENHRLPFLTSEILALSPQVPLALHNYTTFANLLAFPLIPLFGVIRAFNLLVLASGVMSGYAMYVYGRVRSGDAVAAWVGGLLFGFSPFMSARAAEHFSLTLAAPLPVFGLVMYRLYTRPSTALACAAGATVAWAFLCDPYYAVYCLLMAAFTAVYSFFDVRVQSAAARRVWPRVLLNLAILCVAGLIVGLVLRGGGRFDLFGIRLSFTHLYTPVLVLTLLVLLRVWMSIRPRLVRVVEFPPYAQAAAVAGLVCFAMLSPVLSAARTSWSQPAFITPQVWWRNSAPGVDLLAFLAPNPLHPLFGAASYRWFASLPGGFNENVASIPWVAILVILAAVFVGHRPLRGWLAFTAVAACCALGPFITVAEHLTYVPTPWALLRYLPIVGAARMPTRLTVLVMFGVSMLLVMALRDLRQRGPRAGLITAAVTALLAFELLPAPRVLHSAEIPSVYRLVKEDPRPIRVLSLPFGLRDGIHSRGNYSASYQLYQTYHEKRLVGGYLSRLPDDSITRYRSNSTLRVLLRMSEGTPVEPELLERGLMRSGPTLDRLQIGYVVIDRRTASAELQDFVKKAFHLSLVMSEGGLDLYRTPLAPPLERDSARLLPPLP
jgi:hypothetical protein